MGTRRCLGGDKERSEAQQLLAIRARFAICRAKQDARQERRATRMPTLARTIDRLSDKELLRIRFCDLPITLEGTLVEQRARRVFTELAERRIKVTPSIWLAEEWFNPDDTVGFAIPFYLAHPRLVRLERRLMLE